MGDLRLDVLINLSAGFHPRAPHQLEAQGRDEDLLHLLVGQFRADLEEAKDGLDLGFLRGGQAEEGAVEGLGGKEGGRWRGGERMRQGSGWWAIWRGRV